MASPPSSSSMFGPPPSGHSNIFSEHHQYSSSVSPFHAYTGTPSGFSGVPFGPITVAAAAWSCVEKMLHDAQRTSAPSSTSVSISTAVWIVMWRLPETRAPVSGLSSPYWRRSDMRPGISCSASWISLRPNAARDRSATLKSPASSAIESTLSIDRSGPARLQDGAAHPLFSLAMCCCRRGVRFVTCRGRRRVRRAWETCDARPRSGHRTASTGAWRCSSTTAPPASWWPGSSTATPVPRSAGCRRPWPRSSTSPWPSSPGRPPRRDRRRHRGFDQAELLARPIARAVGVPCSAVLRRHPGPPQTGADAVTRRSACPSIEPVHTVGAAVLLVDDVITTGATLSASAIALRLAGAPRVVALVAARTPPPGDLH